MSTAMQNNELTKDGIFDILRTDIRRQLLTILDDADGMAQEELAGRIADRIDQDEQEVRVALVHGHLPMLESCAVIHWSDGEVQHGKQFDRVMKYLSTLDDIES